MVGLDAAGKTTVLYRLKLNELVMTIPTIGDVVLAVVMWFSRNLTKGDVEKSTIQVVDLHVYLEPIRPLFCLQKKVFSNQNKGHLGSRYRNQLSYSQMMMRVSNHHRNL